MKNPSVLDSSVFYHHFLVKIKTDQDKKELNAILSNLEDEFVQMQIFMEERSIWHPSYFGWLKHCVKMLQIYKVDLEEIEVSE